MGRAVGFGLLSFNGAAALTLRKHDLRDVATSAERWLQWGRSVNAAETTKSYRKMLAALQLQWGRSVNAAETG